MVEFKTLSGNKCVVFDKSDVSCVYEVFEPHAYGSKKVTMLVAGGVAIPIQESADAVVAAVTE